jgi:hypothetical protein
MTHTTSNYTTDSVGIVEGILEHAFKSLATQLSVLLFPGLGGRFLVEVDIY